MTNLSKVMDIFSGILSKTTDAPDEDSYRKAKAKTNGHSKKDAAKQIQRQSSGVVSHELWYNPSRDESLSPLQRAYKRRNMEQKNKTMKEWERQRYEAGDPNAPPPNDMFRQNLKKSRFEQRATPGNFIPRPDPKKNTTSENEDETAVILAKESPIQGPGIPPKHSQPSREVVGKGKKASQEIISEAATPDKSTYVVGMEKAEDNIYAIATAAAKGDEDKKEEIVRALKRGKMLLKAFGIMKAPTSEENAAEFNRMVEAANEHKAKRFAEERQIAPDSIDDDTINYSVSDETHQYDSDKALRSKPSMKRVQAGMKRQGRSEADIKDYTDALIAQDKFDQGQTTRGSLDQRYPGTGKFSSIQNFLKAFGVMKAERGKKKRQTYESRDNILRIKRRQLNRGTPGYEGKTLADLDDHERRIQQALGNHDWEPPAHGETPQITSRLNAVEADWAKKRITAERVGDRSWSPIPPRTNRREE